MSIVSGTGTSLVKQPLVETPEEGFVIVGGGQRLQPNRRIPVAVVGKPDQKHHGRKSILQSAEFHRKTHDLTLALGRGSFEETCPK